MQPVSGAAPQITPSEASQPTQTPSAPQPTSKPVHVVPALHELEDVLFDLLASGGIEPSLSHDKLEAIQTFLHEHARERKTHAQFVAFFDKEALPMQPERPNLLALPMVDTRSRSHRAPLLIDPLTVPSMEPTPSEAVPAPPVQPAPAAPAAALELPTGAERRVAWPWVLGFAIAAGFLALGVVGVVELRSELQALRGESKQSAQQLEQLRSETERLRAQVKENAQAAPPSAPSELEHSENSR
jgi:hypothetical protein